MPAPSRVPGGGAGRARLHGYGMRAIAIPSAAADATLQPITIMAGLCFAGFIISLFLKQKSSVD